MIDWFFPSPNILPTFHPQDFQKPLLQQLDLIVSTRDTAKGFSFGDYLSMLWIHGSFITVGLPDDHFPEMSPFIFSPNGAKIGGSHIGSKAEALEMLALADSKQIKPWIETMPMKDISKAMKGVQDGKVRYRYVLTQDLA